MSKLSAEHLARGAYVYVRQSSADQLRHNHESRRRQYALVERARALGWSEVVVIDDDLGVSASGVARPGFERLLAAICRGVVGAVVSIEASRLGRATAATGIRCWNSALWSTPSSWTRMGCMTCATPAIGCSWA